MKTTAKAEMTAILREIFEQNDLMPMLDGQADDVGDWRQETIDHMADQVLTRLRVDPTSEIEMPDPAPAERADG